MFKTIGDLIHKTPWWGVIMAGIATLTALVLFALPLHVIRLVESGATPAESRAIHREIGMAVGERALSLAKGVVGAMRNRTTDTDRQRELDYAMAEIDRARDELTRAENEVSGAIIDSAHEAAQSALESATDAAQSALETAVDAREAVEGAKRDAAERLRDKGVDTGATLKSFDQLIASAQENEKVAAEALAALRALQTERRGAPVELPTPPVVPQPAASGADANVSISIGFPDGKPSLTLSPEVRGDIRAQVGSDVWRVAAGSILILVFIPLFVILLIAKFLLGRSRRALALAERKTREAELSNVSRQVTEARLQALQAQVEPHFLYNTLANVQALNEVDPPAANQMVGHLIQYLRASLPKMREATSTVAQELELVRAYLNILQMRMGERLVFDIRAGDDVLACAFPPMMLPSLVENAVQHGLEPQREGGRIDVVVERLRQPDGESLRVQVKDTGRGLSDAPAHGSGGIGLTNLRERLAALYGARGRFSIASNEPHGVVATIEVPVQSPAAYLASVPQRAATTPAARANASVPRTGWRRVWHATSKTHSLWVRLLARTFMVLMVVLAGLLLVALVGLLTGWLPVHLGDLQLDGLEGLAIGSVGLLVGFGGVALGIAVVVAVLYGLGFLFAGLLVFIPTVILVALFPVLSPFILIGLMVWWGLKRRQA